MVKKPTLSSAKRGFIGFSGNKSRFVVTAILIGVLVLPSVTLVVSNARTTIFSGKLLMCSIADKVVLGAVPNPISVNTSLKLLSVPSKTRFILITTAEESGE
ncbi:hypothetical protein D3C71_1476870 [compost metagenome]